MSKMCYPKGLVKECEINCKKQVTQFLLEICGLEVPSLGWLVENKMCPVSSDAIINNNVRLIEIFPVPVIVLNNNGTIRCVNSNFCNRFGKDAELLLGKRYIEVVLNNKKYDINGRYESTILLSLETEQEFYRRYTSISLEDTSERTRFDVSTKLLRDEKGLVTGVCGVLFDLDESTSLIKSLLEFKIQLLSEKPEVVFTLNKMAAELDSTTKQYSQSVIRLALELGEMLGLDEYRIGELRTSAILHNIGVVGIPKNIYLKNDALTDEEKNIYLNNHPRIAYELLKGVVQFQRVARIILHHHENYDGTGLPDGLKGEGIPIESRIIAIVEAFVLLTTERSYQKAITIKEALKEVEKLSGIHFDPNVVQELRKLIGEKHRADTYGVKNCELNVQPGQYKSKIYEIYTLIRLLNKMFEEEMGKYAKSVHLTFPQVHLMTIVKYHEGLLVSEIARIGAWHISTVMSILGRLFQKRLIRYEPVEKGKGSYVFLTDTGNELLLKAPVFSSDKEKEFMNIFPPQKLGRNLTETYAVLEKYYGESLMDQIKEHIFCACRTNAK